MCWMESGGESWWLQLESSSCSGLHTPAPTCASASADVWAKHPPLQFPVHWCCWGSVTLTTHARQRCALPLRSPQVMISDVREHWNRQSLVLWLSQRNRETNLARQLLTHSWENSKMININIPCAFFSLHIFIFHFRGSKRIVVSPIEISHAEWAILSWRQEKRWESWVKQK